ncbi:STN domain-containing protein, partial [Methyloglobulus morosus]|uniref:STN domain-containing protein n=1 Tax=Methyloglobulus morosus TaxID=1410681 RepID=UPI000560D709
MKPTSSKTGCIPLLGKLANHTTIGLFSLAISFPLCLPAQEQPSANTANHGITVKSQPLYSALTAFAEQSGIQFVYDAALVDGLKTRGISQEHDTKQALRHLLANSGLDYRFTGNNTVVLFKPEHVELNGENDPYLLPVVQVTGDAPDKGNNTTLPKVTVDADATNDVEYYADPYNKDYVIPNATAGTKTDTPIMETPLNVQVIPMPIVSYINKAHCRVHRFLIVSGWLANRFHAW